MKRTTYRDLAEFGLPLVGPESPTFSALVRDIEDRPQFFGSWSPDDLDTAAVLLNQSGQAIITLAHVWQYTNAEGRTRTSRYSNLGSSTQVDVLCGLAEVGQYPGVFILPGSKRLITESGVFGNNLDVLPPDSAERSGTFVAGGGGGGIHRRLSDESTEIELYLDTAIFEDGLCIGPDDSGLFESLTSDLQRQRDTAREIVGVLGKGGSEGQIFEILRPLARHAPPRDEHGRGRLQVLGMFANMAINRLINASGSELRAYFEHVAEPSRLRLHRPTGIQWKR